MCQNIFHRNSNKRWSKFIKTDKHIRPSKLIKVTNVLHLNIFSITLENSLPPITDVGQHNSCQVSTDTIKVF